MKILTIIVLALLTQIVYAQITPNNEPILPVKPAEIKNVAEVELGKKLFFDPRLSKSGFISCNSCHNLSMGGSDNLPTSIGHRWNKGPINSPTVLNATHNIAQFWDGRAKDLQEQAGGPIANPGEMGFTHELAIDVIKSIPGYVTEFKSVYNDDHIDINRLTQAIAAFEATLVTPNAPFDRWLNGDQNAMTQDQLEGYGLFKQSGCTACHSGVNAGSQMYQKMGLIEPYKTDNPTEGRYSVTGKDADRFSYKVPTLRNVELTYPYFHDGMAKTLSEAVDTMGRIQLGKKFTPDENTKIVAFLKSLTGDQPSMTLPILPPSSDKTPQPVPFD